MVWPLFNFVGRNLSNFCVGLLKNFQHQKFILKLSDLYNCHLVKKQFSDVDLNIKIRYLRIHFTPIFLLYSCPMNFSSNLQKVPIKISAEKTFWWYDISHHVWSIGNGWKNTVKKLSTFLTPNWSFELCQLPRLKKIGIVAANNVMWYTIQCRQPLF